MLDHPSVAGVPLPPQDMLFMDKDADAGLEHGKKLIGRIRDLAGIGDGLFFDVGCGWGRAAYGLLASGFSGRYVGFDLLPKQIDWLKEKFSAVHPAYRFEKTHIPGGFEQKDGGNLAADISKLIDGPIETAAALSIFTHVYEETVLDYTSQAFEHLAPGRAFAFTSFLYNADAKSRIEAGQGYFSVRNKHNDHCFFEDVNNPRKVISYSEEWLFDRLRSQGYAVEHVVYGNWCGRDRAVHSDGQDWVVIRKPA